MGQTLTVSPTTARITGRIAVDTWQSLAAACTYTRKEYGWHNGRQQFYSVREPLWWREPDAFCFPSGLVPRVRPLLDPTHVEHPIADLMPRSLPLTLADGTVLYEDQVLAAEHAVHTQRGLYALATNFGKTEWLAALARTWPTARVLVVVDATLLARALATRLATLTGEYIGHLAGGSGRTVPDARITVATIQTLHRRRARLAAWLGSIDALFVDEVHTVSPTGWFPTLAACVNARVRIGCSGTVREVKYPLVTEAYLGPVVYEVTDRQLISTGRSAPVTVLMPRIGHLAPDSTFQHTYEEHIYRHGPRNRLCADFAAACAHAGLATLVSYYRYEHGAKLATLCAERWTGRLMQADGRTPPYHAQLLQDAAGRGEPGIYLVGVGYNKGINLPSARALINAAGWRSERATSQRGGRMVRRKLDGGAQWALIIDPYDLGIDLVKHHAQDRERMYRRKGFTVEVGAAPDLLARIGAVAMTLRGSP